MSPIDIRRRDLATVLEILASHVPECSVYVFGSRVTGKAGRASDLDLVVMTKSPLDALRMADLREGFCESDLPFKVDVSDWARTKEDFRKIISRKRVKIQTGRKKSVALKGQQGF